MQKYSLTVLVNEKVSEPDRKEIFDGLKKNFSNLIKEDVWGVRSLAYDIKHMNKAFFTYFEFEAEPQAVITLDKNIRLTEDIIRHLIVRIEDKRIKKAKYKKEDKQSLQSEDLKQSLQSEDLKQSLQSEDLKKEAEVTKEIEATEATKVTEITEEVVKEKKIRAKKK